MNMKTAIFWGVTPFGSCRNRRFERTYRLHHQGEPISVYQMPVTANVVPSSLILFTLMVETLRSSETFVLTRARRRHVPEDGIPHNRCRENPNLKYQRSVPLNLHVLITFLNL
jgi:hypothetical protein